MKAKYDLFKDFLDDLNYSKSHILRDDENAHSQYTPFIINRAMGMGVDTVLHANEMNSRPQIDKLLHYDYFINSLRKAKRFNKWVKEPKIHNIELISEAFGYSYNKAKEVLPLLSDNDIDVIKWNLRKGGSDEYK